MSSGKVNYPDRRCHFRPIVILVASSLFFITSCSETTDSERNTGGMQDEKLRNMEQILEAGKLRVLTTYSSTNYFLYRGQAMGYEYDMANKLARFLGLQLKVIVAKNTDELIELLLSGKGDMIAAGLTATNDRRQRIVFTDYLYLTKQVLVQRKPENWRRMQRHQIDHKLVKDPIELIGDTVYVKKGTSYYQRLINLQNEIGGNIHIQLVDEEVPTEKLIEMVVEGQIPFTIADQNIANVSASYFPDLDVNTAISFSQRISWAIRKNSPKLLDTINYWITKMKKYNEYYAVYDKYFKSPRSFSKRVSSDFYSKNTGKISPYDDLIKMHAKAIGWDWVLISSIIYQESQFNPTAESWASANGLMQLMPATAQELNVEDVLDPNQNIQAGIRYLKRMWNQWDEIEDSIQRLKFTIASYNCGSQHVADAMKLAKKYNMESHTWDENVEVQLLNLTYSNYYRDDVVSYGYVRGRETVNYVREIFERYRLYRQFIPHTAESR
ncbi:MAG: transporter substrate-binding domain-containing protein [Vicingaceae bacterium]